MQLKRNYTTKPLGLQWRSNRLFIVTAVGLGLFTDLFLYALIVPVLPFMLVDHVGLPPDQIQSNVSNLLAAYAGASVIISPIAGVITDRIGMRSAPFLLGVIALIGATTLLLLGRTVPVLLVARALQGVSASFVWTAGMALCLETVGAGNLGTTIGAIFGFISVGTLVAPMLGGVLYDKGGLIAVFGLAFALLGIDFVMRLLVIEVKIARRYDSGDDIGATAGAEAQPQDPAAEHEDAEETSALLSRSEPDTESEYKIPENIPKALRIMPILPCLASPRLIAALTISFVQAVLLSSLDATVPIIARETYDFSSLQAGLLFLPIGIANFTFGPLLGMCVDKFGTKRLAVSVYLYLVPVLVLLGFGIKTTGGPSNSSHSEASPVTLYAALLSLVGIGTAGMGAPSVVEAGTVVAKYHAADPDFFGQDGPYAQLYSLSFLFFSLGLALGPEVAGNVRVALGYGWMNVVLAGVCVVTAGVCFLFIGERRGKGV
ncbi:MFS transporter [Aspergillus stella-maris]|uniref:MFS transporter n=1 Tax=Aspergillus stella-maris TaxID=1810926 RepID=UPI003CCCD5CD